MLKEILEAIRGNKLPKVVTCPLVPIVIPGITVSNAFDAHDCFGTLFIIEVPTSGIILSATYWDLDDEKTQLDLEVFKAPIAQIASDDAWAPTDDDLLKFVTEISFFALDDHINSATSDVTNIGKGYKAPSGKFWIQAVDRSTKNIAAGNIPRVQLQILSDDPNWQER